MDTMALSAKATLKRYDFISQCLQLFPCVDRIVLYISVSMVTVDAFTL
jgi:hypothetical protein